MVYQDSWPLAPLAPKGNRKFEILPAKICILKETNQILQATQAFIQAVLLKSVFEQILRF